MLRLRCLSRDSSKEKFASSAIAGRRDDEGFIFSGVDCTHGAGIPAGWPLARQPYQLETNTPGVFVAGDVRNGSVKRLTSAAGEGAEAVHYIFKHCSEMR